MTSASGLQELTDMLELNEEVTRFLQYNALLYSKSQWLKAYPAPTDFDGTSG